MKITKLENYINFKSGLTKNINLEEKCVDVNQQSLMLDRFYGIEAQYNKSKSAALANKYCLKIFQDLEKIFNLKLLLPPVISIYNKDRLVDSSCTDNFCIPETQNVLKNEYPYPGRSIFFRRFVNLEQINNITDKRYLNKEASSPHFLSPFIHEWLHSFHLDYIFKKYGYDGECEYMKSIYPTKNTNISGNKILKILESKTLNNHENAIIYENLGRYATLPKNQYLEVFSEAFTKFICDSLDGYKLIKNPIELFMNTDKEFQSIINKILRLK